MKQAMFMIAALVSIGSGALAASGDRITGEYVEARTAEVFAGGCIMNSEAETAGRQAVMAWHVTSGSYDGVVLDGLAIVAAVAADRNLGMRELGGEEPQLVRAMVAVDDRATAAQRDALVALARELTGGLVTEIVQVQAVPIRFVNAATRIEVGAGDFVNLSITKEITHDASCGAMQWFKPFSRHLTASAIGLAEAHSFSGTALGSKWSAPNKRSAFYGTFRY